MKKRIFPILFPLILFLYMGSSFAAPARAPAARIQLSFNGETAECSVSLTAAGQKIKATLELLEEDTLLASWSDSGSSVLVIEGKHQVKSGHTYTVEVYGTIGGKDFEATPISRTCP